MKALGREIKFRCFYNHKMYYALPAIAFDEQGIKRIDLNNDDNDFNSTPDTWVLRKEVINLMQFTGLHDKNGKEIFDGDIVADRSHTDLVFAIEYDNEHAGYYMPEAFEEEHRWPISEVELEVIGNIYESPELLTKENK